jgi:hypothetical protein
MTEDESTAVVGRWSFVIRLFDGAALSLGVEIILC